MENLGLSNRVLQAIPPEKMERFMNLPPERRQGVLTLIKAMDKSGLTPVEMKRECLQNLQLMEDAGADRILIAFNNREDKDPITFKYPIQHNRRD